MIEQLKEYTSPKRKIRVKVNERHLWPLFHPHHYMTDSLASGATFFTFYFYENGTETLFGCMGVIPQISKKPARRSTRLVILPEYQGMGLAKYMINSIGEYYHSKGIVLYSTTFHPRLGNYRDKSILWQPSANNLEENKTRNNFFEETDIHSGIRDGVSMFRYYYDSSNATKDDVINYNLLYDPLELSALKTKRIKQTSPEINEQIRSIETEIKHIQEKVFEQDEIEKEQFIQEQTKQKLQKMFKKSKRKPLTKQERDELKRKKNAK